MSSSGPLVHVSDRRRTPLDWLRLWFLLRDPVGRRDYIISGFALMAVKYLVECALVWSLTGLVYTPLDFLHPFVSARERFILLSLHEVLRERDVVGFTTFFRSGHGIAYTIVAALSCTLLLIGLWWRRQGVRFFHQPGHWLIVSNSLSVGVFLFAAVLAIQRWDAQQMPYSLWMAYYVVMSLLSSGVNFWAAFRAADTRWWKSLFVVGGSMALVNLIALVLNLYSVYAYIYWLGGIATTILLMSAMISDRRTRRARDWPHWSGAGLELVLAAVAIGQVCWNLYLSSR